MAKEIFFINPRKTDDRINMGSIPGIKYPTPLRYPATLTPHDWCITIIDENLKRIRTDDHNPDIVAFTAMTSNAPRAYELASEFQKKGATTVLGGIHASLLPGEAARYVDSVVIGEAETVWPQLIDDFERSALKKVYKGQRVSPDQIITPRKDLDGHLYFVENISTSRGCPVKCDFCSVSQVYGGTYRQRPVEAILNEIEALDHKYFHFSSDNIIGYAGGTKKKQLEERAINLFKGMHARGLNKVWGGQASINIADNQEVLRWAHKAGAAYFYIGFESVNPESLKEINKNINVKHARSYYKEAIQKLHDYGIAVVGAIIVGMDNDDRDCFDRIMDFVHESKVDVFQPTCLTPLPGTAVFDRLMQEGRIIDNKYPEDWSKYDFCKCVFQPKNMSAEELEAGISKLYRQANNLMASAVRTFHAWGYSRNPHTAFLTFSWNYGLKLGFSHLLKSSSRKHKKNHLEDNMPMPIAETKEYLTFSDS